LIFSCPMILEKSMLLSLLAKKTKKEQPDG